jgi:hypothetical protein
LGQYYPEVSSIRHPLPELVELTWIWVKKINRGKHWPMLSKEEFVEKFCALRLIEKSTSWAAAKETVERIVKDLK